jgi:hypothetical protein
MLIAVYDCHLINKLYKYFMFNIFVPESRAQDTDGNKQSACALHAG